LDVYTHKSLHHEETIHNDAYGDNSRLAELGENVLSLAITQRLFWVKPMLPTADIVAEIQELLSDENIDNWVTAYQMKKNLKFNPAVRQEINTLQESRVLMFSYLGAVYYSKGLGPITAWIDRIVKPDADSGSPSRPFYPPPPSTAPPALPQSPPRPTFNSPQGAILSTFNQSAQQGKREIEWKPRSEGSAHLLTWTVDCMMNNPMEGQPEKVLVGSGQGSSMKAAKEMAAKAAATNLGWNFLLSR